MEKSRDSECGGHTVQAEGQISLVIRPPSQQACHAYTVVDLNEVGSSSPALPIVAMGIGSHL